MVPRIKLEDMTTVEIRQGSESLFIQTMKIIEPFELPFLKNNFNLKEADITFFGRLNATTFFSAISFF